MIRSIVRVRARYRRALFLILIALLGSLYGLRYWRGSSSTEPEQSQWLRIQPQLLESQLGLAGRVQAAAQTLLAAPFDGVVREVMAHEGQLVELGQVLMTLDSSQIEVQLRRAQAELLKVQREAQQLQDWENSPEVARARRTVSNARHAVATTQAHLRDTLALFRRGIVARMEVDTLTQQAYMQGQDFIAAEEELKIVLARGQGEDRKIVEMELANARLRYRELAEKYAQQEIKAPFQGFIVRPVQADGGKARVLQPGLQVSQGVPLLNLIKRDQFQIVSQVEETDLHQLRIGMPVQITGDGFAGLTLTGTIATVGIQGRPAGDQSAGAFYDVIVAVNAAPSDTQQRIRLGMNARLAISLYRNEQGIAVPAGIVRTDGMGNHYVHYRSAPDAPIEKINVRLGHPVAQGIELHGLKAGYVQTSE